MPLWRKSPLLKALLRRIKSLWMETSLLPMERWSTFTMQKEGELELGEGPSQKGWAYVHHRERAYNTGALWEWEVGQPPRSTGPRGGHQPISWSFPNMELLKLTWIRMTWYGLLNRIPLLDQVDLLGGEVLPLRLVRAIFLAWWEICVLQRIQLISVSWNNVWLVVATYPLSII